MLVDGTGDRCEPDSSGMTHGNSNSKEELSSEDAIEQLEYDNYLCHDPEKTLSWMSATVPMDGSCTMPIWSFESKDWHLILDLRTPSGVFAERRGWFRGYNMYSYSCRLVIVYWVLLLKLSSWVVQW